VICGQYGSACGVPRVAATSAGGDADKTMERQARLLTHHSQRLRVCPLCIAPAPPRSTVVARPRSTSQAGVSFFAPAGTSCRCTQSKLAVVASGAAGAVDAADSGVDVLLIDGMNLLYLARGTPGDLAAATKLAQWVEYLTSIVSPAGQTAVVFDPPSTRQANEPRIQQPDHAYRQMPSSQQPACGFITSFPPYTRAGA